MKHRGRFSARFTGNRTKHLCASTSLNLFTGPPVGFHWPAESEQLHPDAWCSACEERRLEAGGEWTEEVDASSHSTALRRLLRSSQRDLAAKQESFPMTTSNKSFERPWVVSGPRLARGTVIVAVRSTSSLAIPGRHRQVFLERDQWRAFLRRVRRRSPRIAQKLAQFAERIPPTRWTRKSAGDLSRGPDFATFRIWEYCLEEEKYDETYVRPTRARAIDKGNAVLASAEIRIASGQRFDAYAEVSTFGEAVTCDAPAAFVGADLVDLEPPEVLVHPGPNDVDMSIEDLNQHYRRRRKEIEKAFALPDLQHLSDHLGVARPTAIEWGRAGRDAYLEGKWLTNRSSGRVLLVGRVWPRPTHRGRPLNSSLGLIRVASGPRRSIASGESVPTTFPIEIDKETAFAVFEFLCRHVYEQKPLVATASEEIALRDLCEVLDNELVERFRADYRRVVDRRKGQDEA